MPERKSTKGSAAADFLDLRAHQQLRIARRQSISPPDLAALLQFRKYLIDRAAQMKPIKLQHQKSAVPPRAAGIGRLMRARSKPRNE